MFHQLSASWFFPWRAVSKMAGFQKRRSLSLKRKIEVIEEVEKQPFKKKCAIAEEFEVHRSTLATILKNKEKLREWFYSGTVDASQQKWFWQAKHDNVDRLLGFLFHSFIYQNCNDKTELIFVSEIMSNKSNRCPKHYKSISPFKMCCLFSCEEYTFVIL